MKHIRREDKETLSLCGQVLARDHGPLFSDSYIPYGVAGERDQYCEDCLAVFDSRPTYQEYAGIEAGRAVYREVSPDWAERVVSPSGRVATISYIPAAQAPGAEYTEWAIRMGLFSEAARGRDHYDFQIDGYESISSYYSREQCALAAVRELARIGSSTLEESKTMRRAVG